jgi:hypothetical protein
MMRPARHVRFASVPPSVVSYDASQGKPAVDKRLNELIALVFEHHEDGGVDCPSCQEQLHQLWSLVESGADIQQVLPALAGHLECCHECREEYEAFVAIMRAEACGGTRRCLEEDGLIPQADEE